MAGEIYDFIIGLRAIRSYQDKPLSDEHLDALLEAARWTGSSKNRQSWSFIVVTDPEVRDALAECGDFTDPVRNSAATLVLVQEPEGYEFDTGRVAQNVMLAAKAIGVASCPITLHRDDAAREVLGVPADRRVRYAIALGYPTTDAAPRKFGGRKPASALVHRNLYDA